MPKLPIVKGKQIVKALTKIGFFIHRQRSGSHLIMAHADGRRTTIPMHPGKDMPKGTLKAILNDINISTQKFIEALK